MKRRIGIIQLLLFGFIAGAGVIAILGSGGGGGGGGGIIGAKATGGIAGEFHAAGDGGSINISMSAGKGDIVLGKGTSTKATVTPPTAAEIDSVLDFGSNDLTVSSDVTFMVLTSVAEPEPAIGTPYVDQAGADTNLYVSDGNTTVGDEDPVTGIDIESGATVTIAPGKDGATAVFEISGSLVNHGTITGDGFDITAHVVFNGSRGKITTAGEADGKAGGDITIDAGSHAVNFGAIDASGAATIATDVTGGDAGAISFSAMSSIINTGAITANGGASELGFGGAAGDIILSAGTTLRNSASLNAAGGVGGDSGGAGALVDLMADEGDLVNTGNIDVTGGDVVPDADTGDSNLAAGAAGTITLSAYDGSLLTSGRLNAKGGANGQAGGDGGNVNIDAYRNTVSGNVEVSGSIDVSGGDCRYSVGGHAGAISIANNNSGTSTVDHLEVSFTTFNASGGSDHQGGAAGSISVTFVAAEKDGTDDGDNGEIINAASLIAKGGSSYFEGNPDTTSDGNAGEAGGSVDLVLTGNGYEIINTGKIDVSGGDSVDGVTGAGKGGNIYMNSVYHIDTGASLIADGGADRKGQGGDGGRIRLYADADLVTGGSISADGGRGTTGGNGGLVYVEGGQTVGDAFIRFRASASADGAAESGTGGCVSVDDVQPSIDAEISGTLSADGAPAASLAGDIYEFTTYTQESYLGAGQVCNNFF